MAITTFILAWRYNLVTSNHPWWLTSYAVISHLSPDCHLSLLWFVDCILKCYWYLFYTQSLHNLPSSLCYSPSWQPWQSTVSDLIIIPHHCCGIFRNPVLAIDENQHHSNYHINWNWSCQQCIQFYMAYSWSRIRDIRSPVCSHPIFITVESEIFKESLTKLLCNFFACVL